MTFDDLFWLGLASDGSPDDSEISQISPGMTTDEVESILGEPDEIRSDEVTGTQEWTYSDLVGLEFLIVTFDRAGLVVSTSP